MTSRFNLVRICLGSVLSASVVTSSAQPVFAADDVDFNRDIRPILSDNCFACHGPDANHRKGDLRLDVRDDAVGAKAITPGKPEMSKLVERILSNDPEQMMPPKDSPKRLTAAQKELLKKWIASGAEYQGHWAYQAPKKPSVPAGAQPIDHLVQQRLKKLGLTPSPEADRRTLARRLSFDLIGLPPKTEDVEAFVADQSPDAYKNFVEKLMSSPHYGEKMAISWLDVVRFADTIGYHSDNPRNIYPYRDYVIRAFNENKPFDRFTVEQLAGDLLPEPTVETKVGSAFNRLLLTTEEGGAQAKDYEARYLTDRVRALSTVWLGQTIGCCQCHDHKFDPSTQKDFYALGAFFADIQEAIIGGREPGMPVPSLEQAAELEKLKKAATELEAQFNAPQPQLAEAFVKWQEQQALVAKSETQWTQLKPAKVDAVSKAKLAVQGDNSILVSGPKPDKDNYKLDITGELKNVIGLRVEVLPDGSLPAQGPGRASNGNFVLTEVVANVKHADGTNSDIKFSAARASIEQTFAGDGNPYKAWNAASTIDGDEKGAQWGWAVLPEVGKAQQLLLTLAEPVSIDVGDVLQVELKQQHGNGSHTIGKFRLSATSTNDALQAPLGSAVPSKELVDLLNIPSDKRQPGQTEKLFALYKNVAPELAKLRADRDAARKAATDFEAAFPKCIVSISGNPRTVRILPRGNWMDESGPIMQPALPGYLTSSRTRESSGADTSKDRSLTTSATTTEGKKLNRLDLANWVVSRDNPLTARVFVNRLWKQFFGIGLSKTLDDFGAQGEAPVNPELLDWLAVEFIDSGWNMKHLVRLMVTSSTYRQVSTASKEQLLRDPENRELARQSRYRLDAELVRDNALAVSGLLVQKVGGPSVKPYQPDGYWENLNFPARTWQADQNENQYRRGLYTWWQRSFVHPSMLAFDAPTREECAADRPRSNIPQQALVLLNDPSYVEAARSFALQIVQSGGADSASRLKYAFRRALARDPRPQESEQLTKLVEKLSAQYATDAKAAEAVLKVGIAPMPNGMTPSELATWTNIARVILNLHETVVRS